MAIDWRERITVDPAVLVGKPVVRAMRLAADLVLNLLATRWTFDEILANYLSLIAADIRACVAYVKDVLTDECAFPAAHN